MWGVRFFGFVLLGALVGIFSVGALHALPFPYAEFPLIPIMIALSLVLRAPTHIFWVLLAAVFVTDLYSAQTFGAGLITFLFLVAIGVRVTSEIFTHRSLIGCFMIAALVGGAWVILQTCLLALMEWWHTGAVTFSWVVFLVSCIAQAGVSAVVSAAVYAIIPYWWHARSPVVVHMTNR